MYRYKDIPFNRIIFLDKKKFFFVIITIKNYSPPKIFQDSRKNIRRYQKNLLKLKKTVIMAALANSILYYN